ncbi:MAG: hypothetical protein KC620_21005, partial [Myxococcales bacterium]|nr:hypothetical protein [Myxococcales bacterium]
MFSPRMRWRFAAPLIAVTLAGFAWAGPDDDDDEDMAPEPAVMPSVAPKAAFYNFADVAVEASLAAPEGAMMGATPGGAQDIGYARDRIAAGEIPHPNTFTPEGLFSEHDLPLPQTRKCAQMLCLSGAAA